MGLRQTGAAVSATALVSPGPPTLASGLLSASACGWAGRGRCGSVERRPVKLQHENTQFDITVPVQVHAVPHRKSKIAQNCFCR